MIRLSSKFARLGAAAVSAGALLWATSVGTQPLGEARYLSAGEVHALVAKLTDGVATAAVPTGPGAVVLAAHRNRTGQVEVHVRLNDELIGQAGRASVRVGGTVAGNRETAPGEWRGGEITGGKTYDLGPGDVIWIPAGMPHQMIVPAGGSIHYLAVKFEVRP